MNQTILTVSETKLIADRTWLIRLKGDLSEIRKPGQFVNIRLDGYFLRRPISVCDVDGDTLTLIYKVVGNGTESMTKLLPGDRLDVLCGLGNGFDTSKSGEKPLLIGGGAGTPPMYLLCRELIREGKHPTVILGFGKKSEVFFEDEFRALGADVFITTADGSYGIKGFVTDAFDGLDYTFFYTCGPMPMFRAIEAKAEGDGEYSFEERMGCGFGACMGCSCKTKYGFKRICRDGPVLERSEIVW